MGVSVKQLAVHLRVSADPNQELQEPYREIVTELHRWATAEIENRAPGATEQAKEMATIMLAGYVFDKPASAGGARYADAWTNSGASNVLRQGTTRRGVILE